MHMANMIVHLLYIHELVSRLPLDSAFDHLARCIHCWHAHMHGKAN
jgi:hypothetical protein